MTAGWVNSLKIRRFGTGLLISFLILALDQISKSFMLEFLTNPPRIVPVTTFFNLALGFNRGVSFGFLGDLGSWGPMILSLLALGIVAFLLVWLWSAENAWDGVAISLVIGGALGNVLDRLRSGAVTDFLDFYVGPYHWPAFNLADTGIFIGATILVFRSFHSGATMKRSVANEDSLEHD